MFLVFSICIQNCEVDLCKEKQISLMKSSDYFYSKFVAIAVRDDTLYNHKPQKLMKVV